jgi:hypothetical protein
MIDRYTRQIRPAVSEKELEKLLHENIDPVAIPADPGNQNAD